MIKVQKNDFSLNDEISLLKKRCNNIGALSSFIGIVRDKREDEKLLSMTLDKTHVVKLLRIWFSRTAMPNSKSLLPRIA